LLLEEDPLYGPGAINVVAEIEDLGDVEMVNWRVGAAVAERMTGNFSQPRKGEGTGERHV
jgi:hypothetical protein